MCKKSPLVNVHMVTMHKYRWECSGNPLTWVMAYAKIRPVVLQQVGVVVKPLVLTVSGDSEINNE